jgi:hypothetical protein
MPSISSMEELNRAVAQFEVSDLDLAIEPPALDAARRSLDESGLLLLGEVHGVRENPLLARVLMRAFGLNALALEWPDELAPAIDAFMLSGVLEDHLLLWLGDGRITAGHLAVLREGVESGPLNLTLFDGRVSADANWSARDELMADLILARATGTSPTTGILAVAGNAHTPTSPTHLGIPLGARLARQRPGVLEIRIRYGGGHFYNLEPRRFTPEAGIAPHQVRLHLDRGSLLLDLPEATEAIVPHRPLPAWPTQPRPGTAPKTSPATAPD